MSRDRWDEARTKAAEKADPNGNDELSDSVHRMFLHNMRKRASDLADESTSKLLQHSSVAVTKRHYRRKATILKPVR
jgi:integrase